MKIEKKLKIMLLFSVVWLLLMSCSFLVMPFAGEMALKGHRLYTVLSGTMFWVPMIMGYVLLIIVNVLRKRQTNSGRNKSLKSYGVLKVFSNKWAMLADAAFLIGILGTAVMLFLKPGNYATFAFIFLTVFAFNMHAILNGVNFKYVLPEIK